MEVVLMSLESPSDIEAFEAMEWNWEGFSLKNQTRKFEEGLIQRALRDAGGSVTKAAQLLGFKHHQSLISLISGRHRKLMTSRSKVRRRRQHLFSDVRKGQQASARESSAPKASILHVDDSKSITDLVADVLVDEGIKVESCMSGTVALRKLSSRARYDLIIVDNDLPGLSGLELVRRARKMARWRATPIVMLSGEDCENDAWRAGVDDFLRKPQDINQLAAKIERLLASKRDLTT